MHILIALGLLVIFGIVDATFYNPRSQTINQLMERRQRSIPIPYSYGYHYNPIEPSINILDSISEGLDSRINTFKPIYHNVEMSTHDVNSIPRTYSYQPKNSVYDSEYITVQDIPSLFPEEESVDYKYLGSPLNKYLTRPPTTESDTDINGINLVAIKKTSVFGYGFPTYKFPYSPDSVWNFGSKIPNTIFKDSQPAKIIVKLLPETLDQKSTITTTTKPYHVLFEKLLLETKNEAKNSVKDELIDEITQETPTKDESNSINSEEFPTVDEPNSPVLEENQTEDESSFIKTEETPTEDESNSTTTEKNQYEDESNSPVLEENPTEDESSFIKTEETLTEDESNSTTTEKNQYEDESYSLELEENPTKDESSFIKTEETLTEDEPKSTTTEKTQYEDESNSLVLEENQTKNESSFTTAEETLTEDESNFTATEENQTEDDESKSTTSQETTIPFKLKYLFNQYRHLRSNRYTQKEIKDLMKNYETFRTVENIPAKSQLYFSSDENTSHYMHPHLTNGADIYEEY